MPVGLTLVCADEKSDREKRGTGGDYNKKKNEEAAQIFLLRSLAHFALRRRQNRQPIEREDDDSKRVPTCNCCAREQNMSAQSNECRRTRDQPQGETMVRVQMYGNMSNAHLCSRVTNIPQQWQAAIADAARCSMGSGRLRASRRGRSERNARRVRSPEVPFFSRLTCA